MVRRKIVNIGFDGSFVYFAELDKKMLCYLAKYYTPRLLFKPGVSNQGCEMVIQIFVLHFCTVMLSSSCANCSAQSVSYYTMPSARPLIQPETMLISQEKKKG